MIQRQFNIHVKNILIIKFCGKIFPLFSGAFLQIFVLTNVGIVQSHFDEKFSNYVWMYTTTSTVHQKCN